MKTHKMIPIEDDGVVTYHSVELDYNGHRYLAKSVSIEACETAIEEECEFAQPGTAKRVKGVWEMEAYN